MVDMALGALVVDLDGDLTLTKTDRERLSHPGCGGVILFSRNYKDRQQLQALTASIHELREPALLICVDQEGGRVQRFRSGFTRLPPAASFGKLYDADPEQGLEAARHCGRVMAQELRQCGVDFSFAPVLDVIRAESEVIGDRAFHHDAHAVSALANAYIDGIHAAAMPAVGKHFPGHGGVSTDSHLCLPCDHRALADLENCDLVPYRELLPKLSGIMTAHVHYEHIESQVPAYSQFWLQEVLRGQLGFTGAIFSDDLSMQGAVTDQSIAARADQALRAGCDFLIICNDRAAADEVLAQTGRVAGDSENRTRFSDKVA